MNDLKLSLLLYLINHMLRLTILWETNKNDSKVLSLALLDQWIFSISDPILALRRSVCAALFYYSFVLIQDPQKKNIKHFKHHSKWGIFLQKFVWFITSRCHLNNDHTMMEMEVQKHKEVLFEVDKTVYNRSSLPVSQMVSFNLFPPTVSSLILKSTPVYSWDK